MQSKCSVLEIEILVYMQYRNVIMETSYNPNKFGLEAVGVNRRGNKGQNFTYVRLGPAVLMELGFIEMNSCLLCVHMCARHHQGQQQQRKILHSSSELHQKTPVHLFLCDIHSCNANSLPILPGFHLVRVHDFVLQQESKDYKLIVHPAKYLIIIVLLAASELFTFYHVPDVNFFSNLLVGFILLSSEKHTVLFIKKKKKDFKAALYSQKT